MDIKKKYERWLANATADADVAVELKTLDDTKIEDAFYRDLAFGTGGLRGVIGAGTNRMNIYTVGFTLSSSTTLLKSFPFLFFSPNSDETNILVYPSKPFLVNILLIISSLKYISDVTTTVLLFLTQ